MFLSMILNFTPAVESPLLENNSTNQISKKEVKYTNKTKNRYSRLSSCNQSLDYRNHLFLKLLEVEHYIIMVIWLRIK